MMDAAREDTVWQAAGLAGAYLDGVRGAIPLAAVQIDILTRLARAAQPAPRAILDLGCGDGILGQALRDAFAEVAPTVVLADFSPPMLEAARERFKSRQDGGDPHDSPVHFVEVDYARPDWPKRASGDGLPERYDVIISGFSIHHQPDYGKRRIYADIFDLLTPGGIFLNLEHVASASRWGEEQFEAHFIDALYRYHAPAGRTRDEVAADFYHRPDKSANILAPVELQCAWLREIGFVDVDCFLKLFELALFGGRRPTDNGQQTTNDRP
jgi:SAM-dependent methyltransferase